MANAKERVVYILGAGFSAPLGLPVVSNFLLKSKDMWFANPERFAHFREVFDTIGELSTVKNYFSADLFDIEEVLSILESRAQLVKRECSEMFCKYICDVVQYFTPELTPPGRYSSNWQDFLMGNDSPWNGYAALVSNFLALYAFSEDHNSKLRLEQSEPSALYDVVSLNYDLVLENALAHLKKEFQANIESTFIRQMATKSGDDLHLRLMKLHGSADDGQIIPPTWRKSLNDFLSAQWDTAGEVLSKANHIRILGYSLPQSDAYVRYLLKAAVSKSEHLKRIDVITLDPDGSVRARYDDFIAFKYYRFANQDLGGYLYNIQSNTYSKTKLYEIPAFRFGGLEQTHENYMAAHTK